MVAPRRFDLGRSLALSRGGDNRRRSERQAFCIAKNCAHQDLSWRRLAAADRVSSEAEAGLQSLASVAQN
jgi:hypothetical protein